MWIDRITSDSDEGPQVSDLHKRMTVISSPDRVRRRQPFDRIAAALRVAPGSTIEVTTAYGDAVSAHRTSEGTALFDTRTKLPVHADDHSLGIVGWLNDPAQMNANIDLFHVDAQSLRNRVTTDADLIHLAQTPLDQLFSLADEITTAERLVEKVRDERTDLSQSKRERDVREETLAAQLDERDAGLNKAKLHNFGALALIALGVLTGLVGQLPIGVGLCILGVVVALLGKSHTKDSGADDIGSESSDMQLGRLDELFDTGTLLSSRRSAEDDLEQSKQQWRSIAGDVSPSVLLKDRPRIEELGSHLQLINNANATAPGDTSVLIGLASLLAELTRRFPAERVPLLVEDLFSEVETQHHSLLRELLTRASHRRQVVLETADLETTKWAAIEAVGSNALVVTDYEIDVEPIIANAVDTESTPTV